MKLDCPYCGRALQFSGDCPSFCAYCGQPLENPKLVATGEFVPGAADTATRAAVDAETIGGVPEVVGGFRLGRLLGRGGMGSVYEAEQTGSGRRAAVKLIAAEYGASAETLERFRREGRLASAIAHPRCVFVLAADEEAGRPYIVMELMPGRTLKDAVEQDGPLAPADAVAKILDVIEGLREAHRLGVIHRDVKPSNCFMAGDGRVKVGDFGLAKSLSAEAGLTKSGAFLGTPLYASPEQIRNDPLDAQTDVYSVAATLYFLLTGRAPFEGKDAAAVLARIVADPVPPVRSLRPGVPAALDRVILKGLERNRARRYRDLGELRKALLPFLPQQVSIGSLGLRFGAYWLDGISLYLAFVLPLTLLPTLRGEYTPERDVGDSFIHFLKVGATALYFFIPEWLWGCSLGKWLFRLRVRAAHGDEPPGAGRVLVRTLIFFGFANLGGGMALLLKAAGLDLGAANNVILFALSVSLVSTLGFILLLSTMRPRNGYRGLHELLSGTRVVRLPQTTRDRRLSALIEDQTDLPYDKPTVCPRRSVPSRSGGHCAGRPTKKFCPLRTHDYNAKCGFGYVRRRKRHFPPRAIPSTARPEPVGWQPAGRANGSGTLSSPLPAAPWGESSAGTAS